MKQLKLYLLTISLLTFVQSCIPPSNAKIEQIDQPDYSKIKSFGIRVDEQIVYQFYHQYGFTDLEEHMILIIKPRAPLELVLELPLSTAELDNINSQKFVKDSTINLTILKKAQADIRMEAIEFRTKQEPLIYTNDGSYKITQTDSTEVLILSDRKSGIMYIESKKIR